MAITLSHGDYSSYIVIGTGAQKRNSPKQTYEQTLVR